MWPKIFKIILNFWIFAYGLTHHFQNNFEILNFCICNPKIIALNFEFLNFGSKNSKFQNSFHQILFAFFNPWAKYFKIILKFWSPWLTKAKLFWTFWIFDHPPKNNSDNFELLTPRQNYFENFDFLTPGSKFDGWILKFWNFDFKSKFRGWFLKFWNFDQRIKISNFQN